MITMKNSDQLRRWEDKASMALGVLAAVAPWFFYSVNELPLIIVNAFITGLAIVALAGLDMLVRPHWEEPIEKLLGFWLMVAPSWLGYGGLLMTLHVVTGALVVILAIVEFWQDIKAS